MGIINLAETGLNVADQELLENLIYGGFAEFELTPDERRKAREWAKQGLVERHKCSITNAKYYGFGHNAEPYKGRCCNYANQHFVIPARIELIKQGKNY